MRIIVSLVISFLIGTCFSTAQTFQMEGEIDPVENDGIYSILLMPEITSSLKSDFSDIRIYDSKNKEVPFLLRKEVPVEAKEIFINYEVIEDTVIQNSFTRLIIRNAEKNSIDNITLLIKNADVRKKATLSGSNNNINWFIIKNDYELRSLYNDEQPEVFKMLTFPLSNYEYYQLEINDSASLPISILKAGYINTFHRNTRFIKLPDPAIHQIDSTDKKSYVKILFNSPQYIDRLRFNITGPDYYRRNAQLCSKVKYKNRESFQVISSFNLQSNHSNEINLSSYYARELFLIVDNKDNPPLMIDSLQSLQLGRKIIAGLKQSESYVLRFGDKQANSPQYDLEYFSEKLTENPQEISVRSISAVSGEKQKTREEFFTTRMWIWGAVIGMVLLLGYFSFKMIRDIS